MNEWFVEQSPWEANQQIFGTLCNPKACYCIHKSLPVVPVLYKTNPVYAAPYYICWKYIRVGTSVALAPQLFPIFCATSCFRIQKLRTLNKIHYSADMVSRNDEPGA